MTTTEIAELRQIERELGLTARVISNAECRLALLLKRYKVKIPTQVTASRVWDLHEKVKQAADLASVRG
jgi:hypothetical protein